MSEPRKSSCPRCGKLVIIGTTKKGKKIPLDPRRPVYAVIALEYPPNRETVVRIKKTPTLRRGEGPETHMRYEQGQWLMGAYVSHLSTCRRWRVDA